MIEIVIPSVGESVVEVDLQTWLVAEGDIVKVDQSLVECECVKANFDLPSPWAGKIVKIFHRSGTVPIGAVIAHLEPTEAVVPPVNAAKKMPSVAELFAAARAAGHDSFGIGSDPELQKALETLMLKEERLPLQPWGIALQEAVKARFRATGKYLPVMWHDPESGHAIVCEWS